MLMTLLNLAARLPRIVPATGSWSGVHQFFAHHGVWAVGVRLLRKLSIRAKLVIVLLILMAPVVPMTVLLVQDQGAIVRQSSDRLAAVRLAGAADGVRVALTDELSTIESGQTPESAALASVVQELESAFNADHAHRLGLQQVWERERAVIAAAQQGADRSLERRAELNELAVLAVGRLRQAAAEASGAALVRDPAQHGHSMLALFDLPHLANSLRASYLGLKATASDPALIPTVAMRQQGTVNAAIRYARVEQALQDVVKQYESIGRPDALAEAAFPATRAFMDLLRAEAIRVEGTLDYPTIRASYHEARKEIRLARNSEFEQVEQALQHELTQAEAVRRWIFGALVASILLSQYLLYCFFLVMRGGLRQLNQQMNQMAQGDLSARLSPLGGDEVAQMMRAMTDSLVRLSDLMATMRQGVASVEQAAQQVALGNADMKSRNHETSSGLHVIVDAVTRYSNQLEACGRQVETVVETVQALRLESARNRKQMHRLRERMSALRGKSREIGEIVTLIDTIAFRTNVLALNASVEASKAGEAGRGFAVVAQEVRSLALRGADSARRIAEIVSRSTEDIETSGALADEAGKSMAEADARVDQIHMAMDDVAALTRSGEKDSAEILAQLTSIQGGTDQSLRLVEQLATASGALRQQSERLTHKVAQFRLS
jgi:methyl-accepting chemotaxis protein